MLPITTLPSLNTGSKDILYYSLMKSLRKYKSYLSQH